jgi:hypothetical protein
MLSLGLGMLPLGLGMLCQRTPGRGTITESLTRAAAIADTGA